MRRLCLYFSFLLAALVVAPNANAQDTLKLNQTYQDVIRLSFPAGKTQIPLPEGKWELLGLQEDQSSVAERLWRVYLARVENDTLVGQVSFVINTDLWDAGWTSVDYCDRDNLWFKEVKSNRENNVDCWAVSRFRMRPERWKGGRKQMLDNLLSRNVNVTIPQKMIRAVFIRATTDNYLTIYYYFHTSPPGGPYITREYIKNWGRKWKPKVDAGFLGEVKDFKAKEALAPVKQSPKSSQELGVAVIAGDVAKVKALLSAGADPNAKVSFTRPHWNRGNEWNTRVLVAAIVYRYPKVVDLLLRYKVSVKMYLNAFAICPAVNSRQRQIVWALIKAGIEVNPYFTCIGELTPLESSKLRRYPEIIQLLVDAGAT